MGQSFFSKSFRLVRFDNKLRRVNRQHQKGARCPRNKAALEVLFGFKCQEGKGQNFNAW